MLAPQHFRYVLCLALFTLVTQATSVVGVTEQELTQRVDDKAIAIAVEQVQAAGVIRSWQDVDGNALAFATEDQLLTFLQTAEVIAEKNLSTGVTHPIKLTLRKDGASAHAVYKYVDEEKRSVDFGRGDIERYFRDSYLFEPASYELSRLIGLDNVPPATLRKVGGREGSVQIWVERSRTETMRTKDKSVPPDLLKWSKQVHNMRIFDALIYNTDRTQDNILITSDWKIWLIDHSRGFRTHTSLPDEQKITNCERLVYEHLKNLDAAVLRRRLNPYLRQPQITAVLKRRDLIVKRLDKLIAERGENAVLFTREP